MWCFSRKVRRRVLNEQGMANITDTRGALVRSTCNCFDKAVATEDLSAMSTVTFFPSENWKPFKELFYSKIITMLMNYLELWKKCLQLLHSSTSSSCCQRTWNRKCYFRIFPSICDTQKIKKFQTKRSFTRSQLCGFGNANKANVHLSKLRISNHGLKNFWVVSLELSNLFCISSLSVSIRSTGKY